MLKQAAEFLLARGGPATLAARRRRGRSLILAYHNVVPDDTRPLGDRNLVQVDHDALNAEVIEPLAWLLTRFESVVPWRAYPYGRSRPPRRNGLDASVRACASNRRGMVTVGRDQCFHTSARERVGRPLP